MNTRRKFIKTAGLGIIPVFKGLENENLKRLFLKPLENNLDENDFWNTIREAYTVNPQIVNLNNGGVSPSPRVVQQALEHLNKVANDGPSYYMWRIMDQGREPLRENLAKFAGVEADEIALNRNATEAIDTVILGLPLQKGDEVVLSKYDYPNMLHAWRQREHRDGVVLKFIDLDLPEFDNQLIIKKYEEKLSDKTKIIHLTHIVNWNGQILPVKEIADIAHKKGIEVLIDAAHSFAHLEYKIPQLGADYVGTSLHKWLSAPIGSGMLWIKKEKISKIFPLIPNGEPNSVNIRKFENLGTRSFMIEQAVGYALNFQNSIGNSRKENRLRYLKNYWTSEAQKINRVKLNTPLTSHQSCALAHLSIDGLNAGELEAKLFQKFKIHTSPTQWEKLNGIRITPHVYTSTQDLDRLLEGILYLSKL